MVGSSLIVFQLGNNQNEVHIVSSWELAFGSRGRNFEKNVTETRTKDKWKPDEVVSDAEVEAICKRWGGDKSLSSDKWDADGIHVINISGDPNLYNPMTPILARRKEAHDRKKQAREKLKEYLPELAKLRNAIPTGSLEVNYQLPMVRVRIKYSVSNPISTRDVIKDGKSVNYVVNLIPDEDLAKFPQIAALINCPKRKAYFDRCRELAQKLGLTQTDVENDTYSYVDSLKNAAIVTPPPPDR